MGGGGTAAGAFDGPRSLGALAAAVIFLYSLTLLFVNIDGVVLSRHEVLAAQPAREMLADGHWIVPTIAGEYRVNKPPTMGWMIAASMSIFHSQAEWVARLPAMLAGAGTAVLLAWLTAVELGRRTGRIAGLIVASSFYVLSQARLSEADMPMTFCVVLAYAAFVRGVILRPVEQWIAAANPSIEPPVDATGDAVLPYGANFAPPAKRNWSRHLWPFVFYIATALSLLLKGVGPAFILPACAVYALLRRDKAALWFLLNVPGLIAFLVIAGSWPLAAWLKYPEIYTYWNRELLQRVTGELNEDLGKPADAWYDYFWSVPLMLLPWLPLVVVGAWAGIRRAWHRRPLGLLLLCWFVTGFAILNFSAWKHKHYAMPILPACAPAAAVGFVLWLRFAHAIARPRYGLTLLLWIAGCAAAAVAMLIAAPAGAREMAAILGLLGVCGVGVILLEQWRARQLQVAAIFATAWLVTASVNWLVSPYHDGYRPSADFARRVNAAAPPGVTLSLVAMGEHHVTYYLDRPMRRFDDAAAAVPKVGALSKPAWVIAPAGEMQNLARVGAVRVIDQVQQLSRREKPEDRMTLMRIDSPAPQTSPAGGF